MQGLLERIKIIKKKKESRPPTVKTKTKLSDVTHQVKHLTIKNSFEQYFIIILGHNRRKLSFLCVYIYIYGVEPIKLIENIIRGIGYLTK